MLISYADAMDMLTNLPNEIIENKIFRYLTLQEQARTSVLSKSWEAKWRNLSAPIRTFALEIRETKDSDRVDNVFAILASRRVENLSLAVANYTVPSQIFDLVHLVDLALTGCHLTNPPMASFDGYANLKKVSLCEVKLGVDLNDLISRWCPVLTEFRIRGCRNVRDLVIDARFLVDLEVDTSFRSILFRNVPALKFLRVSTESKLRFPRADMEELQHMSMFQNILDSLPALEDVSIGFEFRQYLALTGMIPHVVPGRMNAIRRITLFDQHMICIEDVAVALSLISRSPNLEELVIHFMYEVESGAYNLENINQLIMSHDNRFQHLRTVTLHGLMGSQSEKEFLRILLARASVLEGLHIFTDVEIAMRDVREIFEYSVSLDQWGVTVDGVPLGQVDDFN
ncbi:F-box/FBD/LRR-repeat protein At1g13570 [Linum perenne]